MQVSMVQTGQLQRTQERSAANPRLDGKIGHAAKEFEALLIAQMLRSARESSADSEGDGAETNSSLKELGEQQFAQSLANSGGLGVAKIVVAGLSRNANR